MTDLAPAPLNDPRPVGDETEAARPDSSAGVAKWGFISATTVCLAGLAVLFFRGGTADLRWKKAGLSYSVNPPSRRADDNAAKDGGPPASTAEGD